MQKHIAICTYSQMKELHVLIDFLHISQIAYNKKKKLKWYSFSIKGPEWFANTAKTIFGELEFINLSLHWRITKHFEKGYLLLLPANIGLVGGPESSPQTVLYSYVTKIK